MNNDPEAQFNHIQKELDKLSQSLNPPKMFPFFFNLILYTTKCRYTYYLHKIVTPITTKFPSRIIFIIEEDSNTTNQNYLNLQVKPISTSNRSEIVFINVEGSYKERIPFLIYPNLISDLPTYLLWTLPIQMSFSILNSISKLVSRIIFDSHTTLNLREFFSNISSFHKNFNPCIADLSWTAISSWRKLLATFFDSQETIESLNSSKKIIITYTSNNQETQFNQNKIQALYLQAWIATSLNWQLNSFNYKECFILNYTNSCKAITEVELKPIMQNQYEIGSIQSIEIIPSTCLGTYFFQRISSNEQISLNYSEIHNCEQCIKPKKRFIKGFEEGLEIVQEVFFPPSPSLFFKSFNFLKNLFEKYNVN